MSSPSQNRIAIGILIFGLLFPLLLKLIGQETFIYQISRIIPYGILALALNIVVGYTGMLHLGIMAFFAIGTYVTAICVQPYLYPFHGGLFTALGLSVVITAVFGIVLGAPTLRLRGDYLALVTLGFGEMVKDTLANLRTITQGTRSITPIELNEHAPLWLVNLGKTTIPENTMYYLCFAFLAAVYILLANIERSRLGRAWVALREDELAAVSMGINATRVRLSAFVLCAAIAGLGGCLFAFVNNSTTDPKNTFDFGHSVIVLACVILGGMGNRLGVLLGVFLILGFDQIIIPSVDEAIGSDTIFQMKNWKLMIYGLSLVLMMRFRPEGLLPEQRIAHELHPEENPN